MDYTFELDFGPDSRVLALSELPQVGPGVAALDVNGQGMLYTTSVWKAPDGVVTDGSWGRSGLGLTVADDALHVTGQLDAGQIAEVVITSPDAEPLIYQVARNKHGFYAAIFELGPIVWRATVDVTHRDA